MPGLATCALCHGFLADLSRPCVHCAAPPPRRRGLARFLLLRLLGVASTVTLMACYGATADYDCYSDGVCCDGDSQCAPGRHCDETTHFCETDTCADDTDCPDGTICDETYRTCVPATPCDSQDDCGYEERCDLDLGTCVPATPCWSGSTCGEDSRCDPDHGVCVPCSGAGCGACTGELTCEAPQPECPPGTQPAIEAGCYTQACRSDDACAAEACAALDEAACTASETCGPSYVGIDCTDPDGDPCTGDGECTCESYEYDACLPDTPPPPA